MYALHKKLYLTVALLWLTSTPVYCVSLREQQAEQALKHAYAEVNTNITTLAKKCSVKNLSQTIEKIVHEAALLPTSFQGEIASNIIRNSKGLSNKLVDEVFRPVLITKFNYPIAAAALNGDGNTVLLSHVDGTIKSYHINDSQKALQEFIITEGSAAPSILNISNKGLRGLASNKGSNEVVVFNPKTGVVNLIHKNDKGFDAAHLSKNGTQAITKSIDGTVDIIDLNNFDKPTHITLKSDPINGIGISGNGQKAIIGTKVIDAKTGQELANGDVNNRPAFEITSNYDGSLVLYHDGTPGIKAFDTVNKRVQKINLPYIPKLIALCEGKPIVAASYFNKQNNSHMIEIVDLDEGTILSRRKCPTCPVNLTFSGNKMLVGYPALSAELIDISPVQNYKKLMDSLTVAQASLLQFWHNHGDKPIEINNNFLASAACTLPFELQQTLIKRQPEPTQKMAARNRRSQHVMNMESPRSRQR